MIKVKEQTYQEKAKMYSKCTKRELIDMLIEANKHIDNLREAKSAIEAKYYND